MKLNNVLKNALQLGDVACHLFLAGIELGGEPIDTLPHRHKIGRHRFELLQIGRRSVWRGLRRQKWKAPCQKGKHRRT